MKKLFLFLLFCLVVFLAFVYLYIPNTASIRRENNFGVSASALYRIVMNAEGPFWKQFGDSGAKGFDFHGHHYRIIDQKLNSLVISIDNRASQFNFISSEADTVQLSWEMRIPMPVNPFKRITAYNEIKGLGSDLDSLLGQMKSYGRDGLRVYGRRIEEAHVKDSILLFTYGETEGYPPLPYIYSLIDQLRAYTVSQSAGITGDPMLHVTTDDSVHFLTKVALPVNKRLPGSGRISYKWMLGGGNILITDVQGGPWAIRQAFTALDAYSADHQRVAPAIPFESLTTNRLQEKDTAKWKTRIYYPVM